MPTEMTPEQTDQRFTPSIEDLQPFFDIARRNHISRNRLPVYGPDDQMPYSQGILSGVISGNGTIYVLRDHSHDEDLQLIVKEAISLYAESLGIDKSSVHAKIKVPSNLVNMMQRQDAAIKGFFDTGIKISAARGTGTMELHGVPTQSQVKALQKCFDAFNFNDLTVELVQDDGKAEYFFLSNQDGEFGKVPLDKLRDAVMRRINQHRLKQFANKTIQACKYFDKIGLFKIAEKLEKLIR